MTDIPAGLPPSWRIPDIAMLDNARMVALEALADTREHPASTRLKAFYSLAGEYAGASFADLPPLAPDLITATDLHATSLLSVRIRPIATRQLLDEDSPHRQAVLAALHNIDSDAALESADASTLACMAELYEAVRVALPAPETRAPNPWVTASKLCARKRPSLFPVRDREVCRLLGLLGAHTRGDYQLDWLVFRHLMRDADVTDAIDRQSAAVRALGATHRVDTERLRVLDAALWTYAIWTSKDARSRTANSEAALPIAEPKPRSRSTSTARGRLLLEHLTNALDQHELN